MSRGREEEHRVRVAAIEQALEIGLPRLAEVVDRSSDRPELVEAAVSEVAHRLGLGPEDHDAIRLAVTAGALVGGLLAVL